MVESQSDASGSVQMGADSPSSQKGLAHRDAPTFVTEESVYGVILVSGMIVARAGTARARGACSGSCSSPSIVFWAAHVYAGTVAPPRPRRRPHDRPAGGVPHRVPPSLGLLPRRRSRSFILLLGATRAIPDASRSGSALWVGVVVLAVLGFDRVPPPRVRRGRSGSSARSAPRSFGVALIVLKARHPLSGEGFHPLRMMRPTPSSR